MENYEQIKRIGRGNYGTAFLVRELAGSKGYHVVKKIPLAHLKREEKAAARQEVGFSHYAAPTSCELATVFSG